MDARKDIKDFTLEELTAELTGQGKERFRAQQIFKWLYTKDVDSFDQMTDLSVALRKQLSKGYRIYRNKLLKRQVSKDGTHKLLFELIDGQTVETVVIPTEGKRLTICISTQVGCKLGCAFCRTAQGGFVRDLTAGEITEQVLASRRELNNDRRISNIVIMGMGEPLLNYDNTIRAIKNFYDPKTFNYSPRKVTLSTAGLVPELEKLGKDIEVSLAISLHASNNETRSKLMPINRKYPIEQLLEVCRNYPLRNRSRITFEYLLIKGVNDSDEDAIRLGKMMAPLKSKVNLIVFNPFEGCDFEPPSEQRVIDFQELVITKHVHTMVRASRGQDILAACGQLRAKQEEKKK